KFRGSLGYVFPQMRHFRPRTKSSRTVHLLESPAVDGRQRFGGNAGEDRPERKLGEATKKPLPVCREEEAWQARSYLSRPDRGELAPASPQGRPVAVASQGPFPQPLWIRFSPNCL